MINYIDRNIDLNRLSDYRLSIQINLNGFSFSIYDEISSKHLVVKSYPYLRNISSQEDLIREVNKILISDKLLISSSCRCIFESSKYTLIPSKFFDDKLLYYYLGFVCSVEELDEIHYKYLQELDAYLIYLIPSPISSLLKSHYNIVHVYNQTHPLVKVASNGQRAGIHINVNHNFFDVVLFEEKQLLLLNSYNFHSLKDILYMLGAILKENQLSQDIEGTIAGEVSKEDLFTLNKYFPCIRQKYNDRMSVLLGKELSSSVNNLIYMSECE